MWIDNQDIPDCMMQQYLDMQRELSRNCGEDALADALMPIFHDLTDTIDKLQKELAVQKRRASYYKNRQRRVSDGSEKT